MTKFKSIAMLVLGMIALQADNKHQVNGLHLKTIAEPAKQHNTKDDDAYMTKVFGRYSTLGLDAAGEANGRRALTKFNAMMAAREIVSDWKGLHGAELDAYLDDKFDSAWHQFDALGQDSLDVRNAYYWMRALAGEEYYSG